VLSPDWRQHRSKSQVDAFTCFGRILNLLEELLLPREENGVASFLSPPSRNGFSCGFLCYYFLSALR
jgi:hypothetical protein